MSFSGNQSFTNARTVVNNFHNYPPQPESGVSSLRDKTFLMPMDEDRRLTLAKKHGFKQIDIGDIIMEREVSSDILDFSIAGRVLKVKNPFRNRVNKNGQATTTVRIRRRVQIAEIIGFRDQDQKFTVVTIEPIDEIDTVNLETVWKRVYEASSSQRREWLPQLFGLGRSPTPTLIFHDESLGGGAVLDRFNQTPVVWSYLWYKFFHSYNAMSFDNDMRRLFKNVTQTRPNEWVFNFRNCSWQYDLTSVVLCDSSLLHNDFNKGRFTDYHLINQLNKDLPLKSETIIDGLQQDFLRLIASLGGMCPVQGKLKDFAHHNLLTFGAIIDLEGPRILAHFPSTPSPRWYVYKYPDGVEVSLSESVPGRIDLIFSEKEDTLRLGFGLKIPHDKREQLQLAHLSQSLGLFRKAGCAAHTWKDLLLLDEVCFILSGILTSNLKQIYLAAQVHLFVTPPFSISIQWINGMPCIHWPFNTPIYYWSSDSEGKLPIPEEDMEQFGIPKLKAEMYFGDFWGTEDYESVREYLKMQGCSPYTGQYAQMQGYTIMNQWDPYANDQIGNGEEDWIWLEDNKQINTKSDPNFITSPSMYSLISQGEPPHTALVSNETIPSSRGGNFLSWLPRGWLNRGE